METPKFFRGGAEAFQYSNSPFNSEKRFNADQFIVDELLDFPNDDGIMVGGDEFGTTDNTTVVVTDGTSTDSSSFTGVGNSAFYGSTTETPSNFFPVQGNIGCRDFTDGQFSTELCVPYDDLAELEWLSNFGEESFSNEDMEKLQLISGMKAQTNDMPQNHQFEPEPNRASSAALFRHEMAVPAKARSKRSRASPRNWTTRLLAVASSSPNTRTPTTTGITPVMSSSSESSVADNTKAGQNKIMYENDCEGRKCFHCAADKTPQWRTGPMGPKTLCNACGVRYKSGRLVPEYRPAASPTFVLTKHSNSHRKVVELRRQNEFFRAQQHQHQQLLHQNMMFDASNGGDFLIHQHLGTDFRQLI